jgi:hypothetical protein
MNAFYGGEMSPHHYFRDFVSVIPAYPLAAGLPADDIMASASPRSTSVVPPIL